VISDADMAAHRESLSTEDAAELARVYSAIADDPVLSRPGDRATAATYQAIVDRRNH
jgi:hypothetical protein